MLSSSQYPYNPNMFSTQQPQQQQQTFTLPSEQPQQDSEDMFLALERLLMSVPPFPPTMPTLAKPTCPSLDDQIMAEIQAVSSPSPAIPSIVLNEQSLDLLQQYYQNQDNQFNQFNQYNPQQQQQQVDQSDCSSTSHSASPPPSPYSYASSLVSSPAMPLASDPFWMINSAPLATQQQELDMSLFDQMSLPMNLYMTPTTTADNNTTSMIQPTTVAAPAPSSKINKTNSHRRSSSACSAMSDSNIRWDQRASSVSSVGSSGSVTTTATTSSTRPVKSYACPTCTKPFPTRTQLKSHMAIHTDSFPFPCVHPGCELHFKRKHDLRRHVDAKHALVKKYLCTGGCGEGFGRRDQMVRHLRKGTCGQNQGFHSD